MEFSGTYEQAEECARSALALMEEKGIPPSPGNFAVWFHYFSKKYPDLLRTLDVLLNEKHDFTEAENEELFQKYFGYGREAAALQEASHRIESELGKILKYLETAGEGAAAYGKALESASGRIEGGESPADLKAIISNLMTATQAMQESNKAIETRLHSSSSEISQLREDLETVRKEALTDGLTGIANRRFFDMELRRAMSEAEETEEDLSLLMVDIDHFKKFNDSYGHQVGDQVLKLLATTLTTILKGQDTAARYGGEEFAVILPNTSLENAGKLAEIIRKTVNGKKVVNRSKNQDLGQISVSIGAGGLARDDTITQLIARADAALYRAKSGGRNRVVVNYDDMDEAEVNVRFQD